MRVPTSSRHAWYSPALEVSLFILSFSTTFSLLTCVYCLIQNSTLFMSKWCNGVSFKFVGSYLHKGRHFCFEISSPFAPCSQRCYNAGHTLPVGRSGDKGGADNLPSFFLLKLRELKLITPHANGCFLRLTKGLFIVAKLRFKASLSLHLFMGFR